MTPYTVVWYPLAEDELSRLWLDADDRRSITKAPDTIDRELANDPDAKGRLVADNLRERFVSPLRVLYSFSEPDRLVGSCWRRVDLSLTAVRRKL